MVELRKTAEMVGLRDMSHDLMRTLKRAGFGDTELADILGVNESAVREKRHELKLKTAFKRIDTCAAEFESFTPYLYSSFEDTCEADPTDKQKVIILGSGPNRIGQGIEFDYCCCHAVFGFKAEGFETVMVNCNPETVSTDYDTADRLYFEPLTFEDVMAVIERERDGNVDVSCVVQFGGQTPLKLALGLQEAGVTILGTSPDSIDLAEDRQRFNQLLWDLGIPQPASGTATSRSRSARGGGQGRLPGSGAAVVRARWPGDGDRLRRGDARSLHGERRGRLARSADPDRSLPRERQGDRRRLRGGRDRRGGDRRHHGAHRGGGHPLGRQLLRRAAAGPGRPAPGHHSRLHAPHRAGVEGDRPDEHAVCDQGRHGLRARGQPARVAHRAVLVEGERRARWRRWRRG